MHYQEEITSEMQKKWFDSINNFNNFYFIIEVDNKKIGLCHGRKVDVDFAFVEGGIFIWDQTYYNTHIAVATSLILADLTFYIFKIKESRAKVLKSNQKVLLYNKRLGYEKYDEDQEVDYMKLSLEKYEKAVILIRKGLGMITNDFFPLNLNEIYLTKNFQKQIIQHIEHYCLPYEKKIIESYLLKVNIIL